MKKKLKLIIPWRLSPGMRKTLLYMKLTFVILLAAILQSFAVESYSQNANLSIKLKNARVQTVLQQIEKQSEFYFLYSRSVVDVDRIVDVEMKNAKIFEVLDELFEGTDVAYKVEERQIVLSRKESQANIESQQQKSISGKVTESSGSPLPGATVLVKGSTNGVITDSDGKFTLANVPTDATLVFSFVGMKTQDVLVGTNNQINIVLEQETIGIDEVIAIGYGGAKKSDLTGSVVRVSTESYKNSSLTQISEMLTGTVAGFSTNQSTGAKGGSAALEIRGPTSLGASTDPLIVLDGVIYNGSINDINPNDLASIDILKDASSAAVFGSKAANGVILVTTTKGSVGKPIINFTSKIGISQMINKDFQPFPGESYLNFRRDFFRSQRHPVPDYYWFSPTNLPAGVTLQQWRDASNNSQADNMQEWYTRMNLFETEKSKATDGETINWMDKVFKTGIDQDYNLSMSGGTKDVHYYWSIGYVDNQGIIVGDKYSTIRSRLNLDGNITDWLKVGINSQFSFSDESTVKADIGSSLEQMSPYGKMWNDDGTVNWYPNDYPMASNPMIDYYGEDMLRKLNNLFASMYAEIKLPLGFTFRSSFQTRISNTKEYDFWNTTTMTGASTYLGGFGTRQDASTSEWTIDNILKWNKEIGIHNFDLTLLQNAEHSLTYISQYSNQNFLPTDALIYHGMSFGTIPAVTSTDTKSTATALMARLNYTLLGKYLLTASIRKDGYSAFGQKNPTATFPALALAWKISDESFFNKNVINRMKLRLSWGVNGNREIGIYSAMAQMGSVKLWDGSNIKTGVYSNTLGNSSLRWERTSATNIGLDIGFLKNKIDLAIDLYDSYTSDLLMNRQLPQITGFSSIMANIGKMGNRGCEITLNTVNITRPEFSWKSSMVFSLNRNKIIHLFGDISTFTLLGDEQTGEVPDFTNNWFPGKALDAVWNYKILGIWQNEEATQAAVYKQFPGWYKGLDVNGDGVYTAVQDKQFIGYTQPRYRLGFRNDFTFLKNFTASVFVRADLGHLGDYSNVVLEGHTTFDRRDAWVRPYWTPTDPNSAWPSLSHEWDAFGGGLSIYKPKSFVRVQDLSLAYNLPSSLAHKIKVNDMRIFVSVRNLATFTNWPGWDPETSGLEPMPRTYTLGLSFNL